MATIDSVDVGRTPPISRTPGIDQVRKFDGVSLPVTWKRRTGSTEVILVQVRLVSALTRQGLANSFLARGSQTSFTFTDDDAVNYTCKYWMDSMPFRLQQGGRWDVDILLLKVA